MLLELKNIDKSFGVQSILSDVSLTLAAGDRVGLLGQNGAGKSTLLRVITGEIAPDAGEISLAAGVEIGYMRQNDALDLQNDIQSEVRSVFAGVLAIGSRLDELRAQLAAGPQSGPAHDALLQEYDSLLAQFEAKDGYHIDVKTAAVLGGMGFGGYDKSLSVSSLSGGEKTRLALAKLLLRDLQLLVLDEPTNHLDFETLDWLEDYLSAYKGALVVVSHDRYFLDKVMRDTCELERCRLTRYKGGYSQFVRQKAEHLEFWQKQYERQQEKIAKLEDYVARNIARATTANMAKSRVHMLENMERIPRPPGDLKTTRLRFSFESEPYKDVLIAEDISVSVGSGEGLKQLCRGIELHVERGEKIALIGQNGVGKSSFLKALLSLLPADGRIKWGTNTKISFFEQENRQLNPGLSVIEQVRNRFPRKTETELRTLLGSLLLSGDDIYKKISQISGGERAKVAFCLMILERANVLILDEPTNHLDYKTKEVLEEALIAFEGTILMVSHDRYLLNRVPTRILEMFPERLVSYPGGYDYYAAHRQAPKGEKAPRKKEPSPAQNGFYRSKAQRAAEQKRKSAVAALEKEIETLEGDISALEREIADPETATDYQRLNDCCHTLEEKRAALTALMEQWLVLTDESAREESLKE